MARSGRNGVVTLILAFLSCSLIVVAEVVAMLALLPFGLPEDSIWFTIGPEWGGALAAMGCVALLGGKRALRPKKGEVAYVFRFGWWCMVVAVGLLIFELVDYHLQGYQIVEGWPQRLAETMLLCLGIGLLEEFMFRGLLFNGLLAAMGDSHRGVVWATFICSVAFGIAHIDFSEDFTDVLSVIQALLKVVQVGGYSIMLCVMVLRTKSLYGVSLFHAVDDFLIFLPSVVLYGESTDVDYVATGDEAYYSIAFYLIVIVLYLPLVIKALRELRRGQDVWRGLFMKNSEPNDGGSSLQADERPPAPTGLPPVNEVSPPLIPEQKGGPLPDVEEWTVAPSTAANKTVL